MRYIVTQPKDYWIAPNAVNITLNALGDKNRIQCSVVSGAVIMCFLEDVKPASQGGDPENGDGLYYGANHEPKRWPISISPTYFNSDTHKYVYVAIPRSEAIGTQAVIVFPSKELDIYGRALRLQDGDDEPTYEQIGSTDYFYVYLNGIISAVYTDAGVEKRRWEVAITDWGRLDTAQGRDDKQNQSEWYLYSQADKFVTFLKDIVMSADSSFRNLILNHKSLTDVATSAEETLVDSDTMVATPNYVQKFYLSKAIDDEAAGEIGFLKGLWIKAKGLFGFDADGNIVANTIKALSGLINSLQSANYKEGELMGTGYQLTNDNGEGLSKLEADIIVARTRFIVNELQVRKYVAMGGNYVFSPAASQIERVDYYDANGNLLGYDMLKVPLMARIGTALKNMLMRSGNTTKVLTIRKFMRTTDPIDMSQVAFFRCWIKADDGTTRTINTWQSGMLARCQTADIEEINGREGGKDVEVNGKTSHGNVFYWRLVKAAGQGKFPDLADDDKVHSYVDLSNFGGTEAMNYADREYASGSMAPAAGDDIVCFGATKRAYSNLTIIETTTSDAPAIKEYYGIGLRDNARDNTHGEPINWSLDGKEVTKISPKGDEFSADHFTIRIGNNTYGWQAYFDMREDNIKLMLADTGINIVDKKINLIADKTTFSTTDDKQMIAVQMCDANGNVGNGAQYNIPSIVFYDGEIGQENTKKKWVLNYLGFIAATNAGVRFTFTERYDFFCFDMDSGEQMEHRGITADWYVYSNDMLYREFYSWNRQIESMLNFTSGYYVQNGQIIYQPTNGIYYQCYNGRADLPRFWLTDQVSIDFVPNYEPKMIGNLPERDEQGFVIPTEDSTNAPCQGYYYTDVKDYGGGSAMIDINYPTAEQKVPYTEPTVSNRAEPISNDPWVVIDGIKLITLVHFNDDGVIDARIKDAIALYFETNSTGLLAYTAICINKQYGSGSGDRDWQRSVNIQDVIDAFSD